MSKLSTSPMKLIITLEDLDPPFMDSGESKKFSTNLSAVSPSDGQETKTFKPVLFEVEKKFAVLFEESTEGTYNMFDGQGRRHYNLKKLESLPSNAERLHMLYSYSDLSRAPAKQGKMYPWHPRLDGLAEKSDSSRMLDGSSSRKESMWDDDDDSSVDGELLNEYLERAGAKDLTKKEDEVNMDDSLRKLDADEYHSLSTLQKLNWITWQLLLGHYRTPLRKPKPGPPSEPGQSEAGPWFMYSDYGQSDYAEDPSEEESYYKDSDEDE